MFLIFMFIISLGANAFGDETSISEFRTIDSISSIQNVHTDFLTSGDGQSIVQNLQRNYELTINNRKSDNLNDGNINKYFFIEESQFHELLAYIYNQSFLHNKSKVLFSVNLSEIQPNAP